MANKKSFSARAKELKLTSTVKLRDFLKGKKIEILKNSNSHDYSVKGTIIELNEDLVVSGTTSLYRGKPNGGGNTIRFPDFHLIESSTIEDIQNDSKEIKAEIEKLKNQIKENDAKLAYLKETGEDTYDEMEFKAYQTLTLLEDPALSKLEKAKLIGQLVNSK